MQRHPGLEPGSIALPATGKIWIPHQVRNDNRLVLFVIAPHGLIIFRLSATVHQPIYIVILTHYPYDIVDHETLMRIRGMKGFIATLHPYNQAMVLLPNACFTKRQPEEGRIVVYLKLTENHFALLYHIRIECSRLLHVFTESRQFLVCSNHLNLVLWKQTHIGTRNVETPPATQDGDDMHSILAAELQLP